jgi:hypothetical protein
MINNNARDDKKSNNDAKNILSLDRTTLQRRATLRIKSALRAGEPSVEGNEQGEGGR